MFPPPKQSQRNPQQPPATPSDPPSNHQMPPRRPNRKNYACNALPLQASPRAASPPSLGPPYPRRKATLAPRSTLTLAAGFSGRQDPGSVRHKKSFQHLVMFHCGWCESWPPREVLPVCLLLPGSLRVWAHAWGPSSISTVVPSAIARQPSPVPHRSSRQRWGGAKGRRGRGVGEGDGWKGWSAEGSRPTPDQQAIDAECAISGGRAAEIGALVWAAPTR